MVLLALAAVAASAQSPSAPSRPAIEQATATVRIVSGARISAAETPDTALVRNATIRQADGSDTTVKLIEFP
jgi:hypothetical protein